MNTKESNCQILRPLAVRPTTAARKQALLETIAQYVDDHLAEKITLKDMADVCGVSISTIIQLYQKTGTTFHEELTRRRMIAAERLIRCGVPLVDIGGKVGYNDHSTFFRAFKLTYGMSLREYRKRLEDQMPL